MSRTYTGKIHVSQRRVTRANGNVYVYERHTQYDRETQIAFLISPSFSSHT